jgi:hypothetical protein
MSHPKRSSVYYALRNAKILYRSAEDTTNLALFAHMAAENALKVARETPNVDATLLSAIQLTVTQCEKAAKDAQEKFLRANVELAAVRKV